MSVIIKGMRMPHHCLDCPLIVAVDHSIPICPFFARTRKKISIEPKRPDWCPLVEIPDEHGRLVDADKLLAEAKEQSGPMTGDGWDNWGVYDLIERQKTVVEAEEKSNETQNHH